MTKNTLLEENTLSFSIESRVLRELGERLVKQPEVALVELIKNAHDADATECAIIYDAPTRITIADNGLGMTISRFTDGWMRIGTSAKEALKHSPLYHRLITGEKGIGRFAVRFLGRRLHLESVADDRNRQLRTRLIADFDWPRFDKHEELGDVQVPYQLEAVDPKTPTGTTLTITRLRSEVAKLELKKVRNGSIGMLSPLRSLFRSTTDGGSPEQGTAASPDPGFILNIETDDDEKSEDVAAAILDRYVLRAKLRLNGNKLDLRVYSRDSPRKPVLKVIDTYPSELGKLYADIRFFPRRSGTFTDMPVNGKSAMSFISQNSGIAVFDRNFRVQPYGMASDDWLQLAADNARNHRDPRSAISQKHFPMSQAVRKSTAENWMLRLPQSAQLVGLVKVEGRRHDEIKKGSEIEGLVASADREGFVENRAFKQLHDLVRGAVEAIAYVDRLLQQEEKEALREALIASIRTETQTAIAEIRANPNIAEADKTRIVTALAQTQHLAEEQEEASRKREQQLEIMSLLGVVAGFMTHEFGIALQELEHSHKQLSELAERQPKLARAANNLADHIKSLREFVTYSSGYIQGAKTFPKKAYPVRPRLAQVKKYFGKYADERKIDVEISADPNLQAPLVPASLYNGITLNLYTNALKAVTGKAVDKRGKIAFRAWNENRWHYLEVSDSGIGISNALRKRVFDPLFTTTESQHDPLGSGMGLGLALVRRGVEAFGGRVDFVSPPPEFATCIRVRLPLESEK